MLRLLADHAPLTLTDRIDRTVDLGMAHEMASRASPRTGSLQLRRAR
jgi:hypothetical protein